MPASKARWSVLSSGVTAFVSIGDAGSASVSAWTLAASAIFLIGPGLKAEAEPAAPIETKVVVPEDKTDQKALVAGMKEGQEATERAKSPAPEAIVEDADYIYRHASVKKLSEEEVLEARHYARKLKYPKGALVFNDTTVSRTTKKYSFAER